MAVNLQRYALDAKNLVAAAQTLADERKHTQVEPLHLLARMLERDRGVQAVFKAAGANPADLGPETETQLNRLPVSSRGLPFLSNAMLNLLARAEREADRDEGAKLVEGAREVTIEHLLNAMSQEIRGAAAVVLQAFGIGPGSLRPHMAALQSAPRGGAQDEAGAKAAATADPLALYTHNLTKDAESDSLDPVLGRDVEVRRLLQILERRQKNHPLLVGEPGVGKTAVVRALAMRAAAGDVPHNLSAMNLYELEPSALTAGTRLRGEVEDRFKKLMNELGGQRAILYISAIDALYSQNGLSSGLGDLLKPLLARGQIQVLADTTPDGLKRLEEKDPALLRRFTTLQIEPPSEAQAVEVLRGIASKFEEHHAVNIGDPAIVASVQLARRYIQERALPDSALDLLDEAAARKRVEIDGLPAEVDQVIRRLASVRTQLKGLATDTDAMSLKTKGALEAELAVLEPKVTELRAQLDSRKGAFAAQAALGEELTKAEAALVEAKAKHDFAKLGELEHVQIPDIRARLATANRVVGELGGAQASSRTVTEQDIATVLGDWTGIPVAKMLEAESEKLLKMEARLAERVVGQTEAVRALSRAVRRGRVGLRDQGKPIGSFLFLGPSGVGKTELAKALAEFLFDDETAMTRLDMSEFMEKHMAQRLVGAPPGYVDSEEGGFLTEAVRRRPYSVLLFDEIEKAHADVFNLLLQVLDDGRLTDGRGRRADFSNTVVVMTSNIGSQRILETDPKLLDSEEGRGALGDVLQDELRAFLRPEFLNRIDDVIVFRSLSKPDLRGIVDIQLRRLEKMLEDREIQLHLSEAAKQHLVELGYEPLFGARPLKRVILKQLQDPLAEAMLAGGYPPGSTIEVDLADGQLTFKS